MNRLGVVVVVTLFLWASAFVGIRVAIEHYSPGALALFRFLVALLLLTSYTAATGRGASVRRSTRADCLGFAARGLTGVFIYHLALNAGERTVSARLLDEAVPRSNFDARCEEILQEVAASSDRPDIPTSVVLSPLDKTLGDDRIDYEFVSVYLDRDGQHATLEVRGPQSGVADDPNAAEQQGDRFWPLQVMRELDDALLELRFNEPELGTIFLKSHGEPARVAEYDEFVATHANLVGVCEVELYTRRVFKLLDLTSRSLFALLASSFH